MSFVLQRSETEIKRTTLATQIPNNDVAHLMYYLYCVCTAIDCNNDSEVQRFTSYQTWNRLTIDEQKILVVLCYNFRPDVLNNKVFFQKDSLCVEFENEFYEISQVNNILAGADSIVIAGRTRHVNKFMTYKLSWLHKYYIGPLGRLTQRLNTSVRPPTSQPIEYRPVTSYSSPTTNKKSSTPAKSKCGKKYLCIIVCCCILFILPSLIAGIITATRK